MSIEETEGSVELPRIPGIGWNEPLVPAKNGLGDVGLELELEGRLYQGRDLNKVKSKSGVFWTVHNDGSLRNGGLEYVLSSPCFIDEVPELTEGLFSVLAANNCDIQNSNRTSTHVHVNISGLKASEITGMIALWGVVEPLVIEWCGPLRKSNHFCLTASDTGGWVPNQWVDALRNGRFFWDNTWKYSALNLGSFRNLGSLEFRCMAGAESSKQVNDFARLLWALREEGKKVLPDRIGYSVSEDSPEGILRRLRDDYRLEIVDDLLKQPDVNHRCIQNFREYQLMAFLYPWSDLKDEINKKFIRNPFTNKPIGVPREAEVRVGRPEALRIEDIDWAAPAPPRRVRIEPRQQVVEPRRPRERLVIRDREYRRLVVTTAGSHEDVARIFGYEIGDVVVIDGFYYGARNV